MGHVGSQWAPEASQGGQAPSPSLSITLPLVLPAPPGEGSPSLNRATLITSSQTSFQGKGCGACMLSRFSHVQLCATLWTIARQAPLSMGFSRQEYWGGVP